MKKIEQFQITSLMLSGFKSYEEPTELVFGNPTVITGGNGRGKSSIADAIAFAVTGCPFFGERGIDRLHNENNPDAAIRMCFVDETGTLHELNRTRRKNRMTITYDGYEIRQLDLADLFGERDVFLSIFNPLYFIEELGEDGKKLLERYLPTIPHETVLSQLSEPVREHLKNETILSPEGSLKRCREEIRGLEERITYLRGQKDLAASQGESHEQAEQELTLQADTLREEIAELEQRQFSGMDVSDMQERLVELSGRYEEAARDERADTSKLREQLQLLREKIARREVEKYQSKFTEASARVKDLGVRYQRENAAYKAFHAGMECPACHRSVTEQSLSEVQAALKKVLSELYAAGSEQRAQLIELQEMDKKAADTFARFKEDDLGKWAAEAAEMEQRCAVYSDMLAHLTLLPKHGENLLERGLSEERIRRNEYRSMPETERGRRLLADLLRSHGHDLHGIPGFRTYYGDWTLSGPNGFLIPVRNKEGLIQGLKIRLNDAQQANRKYRWLSSRNLPSGTRSYSWVHVTGNTQSKRAFLTEGPLKGDVASFLAQDALFICIGGVNALNGLNDTVRELGVREVVEAMDMDQMTNPNVRKAILTMRKEVQKIPGIRYAKYTWNPAYKGVDDYLLSRAATM